MKSKTLLLSTFVGLGVAVLATACHRKDGAVTLTGAGATFPNPIYQKWFDSFHGVDGTVTVNYQPIGSGGGVKQITEGTVDFGASDGPMSDAELAKAPGKILHIPTVAGAVVVTYNVPGVETLKLDGATLAGLFTGKIAKWNAPEITSLNPGVNLPDQNVVVVHRAESSGTNYIFTDYLSSVSDDWAKGPGKGKEVNWPTGLGGKGNEGVTGQIKQTPGAIGYVELIYALQQKLPFADIRNAAGEFIKASPESVTAALATAKIPDDFRFSIVNAPGSGAYPISGATWLLVYQQQKDSAKGKKLVAFLKWALTDGEKLAGSLQYAALPDSVQKRVLERIDTIEVK